nr:ribonuclease H-like domain-containing protein [Tanacetum cinerariifolium]
MKGGDKNGDHLETSNTTPPIPPPIQQIPHIVSSIKLLILKKGEYDIWAMKMEHYLCHMDYPIWQVIQIGNAHVSVIIDTHRMIKVLPPKTAEEVVAKERERKARTTLLMALPEDHLAKFHLMANAKEMWEAIKSRFDGNDESKKMQKYLSLPSSWSQVALIMRTNLGLDTLSFDDLYNNLRVFEHDVKGTTASSTTTQNMTFVSGENTSNTNTVSTAYSVSSPSVLKSQQEGSSSYTDEVIHSFFANQSSSPQLDYDDLEQINDDDVEEMDLKWQVAIISMRIKKFHKRTRRKLKFILRIQAKGNSRDAGYNGNKARDNNRRPAYQEDLNDSVTVDGEDIDWSGHVEEDAKNYVMMAYSNSCSNNEVQSCSQACADSYARLKKLYDEQRDQLEALKEKEDLKTKVENWQNSSKNLSRLLNTQMNDNDKFGLGYGDYRYGSILSYENEVLQSVFMNKEYDLENTPVNDRYAEGMHAVPPPMTGNYMPSRPDVEIDYSKFTYGLKQPSADDLDSKTSDYASCESDSSVEPSTSMPEPIVNESKVISKLKAVCEPKVWTDAPIIEEYESDSDDDLVFNVQEDKEKSSCAFIDSVKHVNTARENIKEKVNAARQNYSSQAASTKTASKFNTARPLDDPHKALKDKGIVDSVCSRHMTGNKAHLADYQEFKGGSIA